jgi:lipid-binding SYLF domain-containing protein
MKRILVALVTIPLLFAPGDLLAAKKSKAQKKREKIDRIEKDTLERLFEDSPLARRYSEKAYGHAVFDSTRVTFGITGGGGTGVAVRNESGERTYMRMGTGGVAVGIGAQVYRVVFFFENKKVFDDFVNKGWKAEAGANAAAGDKGANAEAQFINGIAYYQLTQAGLIASADISGTKYWKSDKLNKE